LRERAHVFDLEPGMGAYMPSTSPHLVENGDGPSVTASFTYYTRATRRNARLHALHQRLRGVGFQPTPVGHRPARDGVALAGYRVAEACTSLVDRVRGRTRLSDLAPYAHATMA
ncbi:MAG TPA: hypothetical protein VH328_14685, partial [Burkholderiaceae bacterium]|nr:hypothetical protein [Burkholderiaceae bacterium]